MSNDTNHSWSARERETMKKLYGESTPPPELESQTFAALGRHGLFGVPAANRWPQRVAFLLGAAALYLIGFFSPAVLARFENAPAVSGEYLLLLHETPESLGASEPDQVQEYTRWARQLDDAGTLKSGEKLTATISSLSEKGTVADENFGPGRVSGFFLLYAPTYEEALAIARTCPHLKYGGTIEVRQIDHGKG